MTLPNEFKTQVAAALLAQRANYTGTDERYAGQYGISGSVYSQIKNGKPLDGLLRDAQWMEIGQRLNVSRGERKWTMVATEVFRKIEAGVVFCQRHQRSMLYVDDCGIGKTFSGKYLARTLTNCFWLDARQGTTKQAFVRLIARTIGVDAGGRLLDVKERIKYALRTLQNPIVIIDEAGAPAYEALMELLEFWNATEGLCGWYLMGADGLRDKIKRGIDGHKVGFAELLSRFGDRYNSSVPTTGQERLAFMQKLITDVLTANVADKKAIPGLVKRCLANDGNRIGGLRRAETLAIMHAETKATETTKPL